MGPPRTGDPAQRNACRFSTDPRSRCERRPKAKPRHRRGLAMTTDETPASCRDPVEPEGKSLMRTTWPSASTTGSNATGRAHPSRRRRTTRPGKSKAARGRAPIRRNPANRTRPLARPDAFAYCLNLIRLCVRNNLTEWARRQFPVNDSAIGAHLLRAYPPNYPQRRATLTWTGGEATS